MVVMIKLPKQSQPKPPDDLPVDDCASTDQIIDEWIVTIAKRDARRDYERLYGSKGLS